MGLATLSDIRLLWVKRFLSVARHQNLANAATECNVDPTALSDSIQRLEQALNRPLMIPTTALLFLIGKRFVRTAKKVMRLVETLDCPTANISVGWFQSLIAVSQYDNYSAAARALGWNRNKVMRGVEELEKCVGEPLIISRGGLKLTLKGEGVLGVAQEIVEILKRFSGKPEGPVLKRRARALPWYFHTYDEHGSRKEPLLLRAKNFNPWSDADDT